MLDLEITNQFKRDLKKIQKQQKNKELLNSIIEKLQHEHPLRIVLEITSCSCAKIQFIEFLDRPVSEGSDPSLKRGLQPSLPLLPCGVQNIPHSAHHSLLD